jgi:hypothetical protein
LKLTGISPSFLRTELNLSERAERKKDKGDKKGTKHRKYGKRPKKYFKLIKRQKTSERQKG